MLMLGVSCHSVPTPPVHPQRVSLVAKVSMTFVAPTTVCNDHALLMPPYARPPVTYSSTLSTTTPARVLMVPNDLISLLTVKLSKSKPTPLSEMKCDWSRFAQLQSASKPKTVQPRWKL